MINVLMYPNPSAAAYWRLIDPAKQMMKSEKFNVKIPQGGIQEEAIRWADIIVLHNVVDKKGIALIYAYQQERGKKIIVDCDDWLEVASDNPHAKEHEVMDAKETMKKVVEIADLVTTTTTYLANKLRTINPNVRILPNLMDLDRWMLEPIKNTSDRIRIGWAGSLTHVKDLELISDTLNNLMDKNSNIQLVLLGDPRLKALFPNKNVETMLGVPFDAYPKRLYGLQLDIGIAPLEDTEFNRCKSPIKPLEYGIAGVPTVASRVEPYIELEDFVYLCNTSNSWRTQLEFLIEDPFLRRDVGTKARNTVIRKYNLQDRANYWFDAYENLI